MNLQEAIPPQHRRTLYLAYGFAGLVLGGWQVYVVSINTAQPSVLTGSLAVFGFIGTYLGITAAANTPTAGNREALGKLGTVQGEVSEVDDDDEDPEALVAESDSEVPEEEIPGDWSGADSETAESDLQGR